MKKYAVKVEWSMAYIFEATIEVEADTEKDAIELARDEAYNSELEKYFVDEKTLSEEAKIIKEK